MVTNRIETAVEIAALRALVRSLLISFVATRPAQAREIIRTLHSGVEHAIDDTLRLDESLGLPPAYVKSIVMQRANSVLDGAHRPMGLIRTA